MSAADEFARIAPTLRRRPDVEAHDLVAADASDRLILESAGLDHPAPAADRAREMPASGPDERPKRGISAAPRQFAGVVVVGDRHGALTLPLAAAGYRVRVHQDALSGERAARLNAAEVGLAEPPRHPESEEADGASMVADADRIVVPGVSWHALDADMFAGAALVLMQLPRSLDALDEIAGLIAAQADPAVRIVAGGRVKHMSPAMNDVFARHFETVTADRGVGKSRVLRASVPRARLQGAAERAPAAGAGRTDPDAPAWPRAQRDEATGLTICAHGAAFAGTGVDIGTRLLLSVLHRAPAASRAIDLGCGTGIIAVSYALAHPDARDIASDQSAAAVASAMATAAANGVASDEGIDLVSREHPASDSRHEHGLSWPPGTTSGVTVIRDDALGAQPDASADLVLLNPPFHSGAAVTTEIAPRLFADAARVLRQGGELWCVWNSHLRYRPELEKLVGTTRQVARNAKFTVTASTR
ncbi:MAG: class I SAM-dependent methyltransferase [Microbacterium sp.]